MNLQSVQQQEASSLQQPKKTQVQKSPTQQHMISVASPMPWVCSLLSGSWCSSLLPVLSPLSSITRPDLEAGILKWLTLETEKIKYSTQHISLYFIRIRSGQPLKGNFQYFIITILFSFLQKMSQLPFYSTDFLKQIMRQLARPSVMH